jgi:hypothetical protein
VKNLVIAAAVAVVCAVLFVVIIAATAVGYSNTEVDLRNRFNAQLKVNESSFDKTWKVIQQETQIASHERESFRKTFTEIMAAQQGIAGKGALASFFTQAKVEVDSSLFLRLMNSVEAQRESFHRDQMVITQIKKQHDDCLTKFPSSLICGGRPPLDLQIVSSSKTKEVFSSGEDNEIGLSL